jgi:hypothetical protein
MIAILSEGLGVRQEDHERPLMAMASRWWKAQVPVTRRGNLAGRGCTSSGCQVPAVMNDGPLAAAELLLREKFLVAARSDARRVLLGPFPASSPALAGGQLPGRRRGEPRGGRLGGSSIAAPWPRRPPRPSSSSDVLLRLDEVRWRRTVSICRKRGRARQDHPGWPRGGRRKGLVELLHGMTVRRPTSQILIIFRSSG